MKEDYLDPPGPNGTVARTGVIHTTGTEPAPRHRADFGSLPEALDYAARFPEAGVNFYNVRGQCEHSLSYGEVRGRALQMASRLLGLGLRRGEHVGITAHMVPDFICLFFACQYSGLVAVPLPVLSGLGNREGYEKQLSRILEASDIAAIGVPEAQRERIVEIARNLPAGRIFSPGALLSQPPSPEPLVPLDRDAISHIQFSSGSTRKPAGIVISQRALMANAFLVGQYGLRLGAGDRVASWLPFYHDMGLVGHCLQPLMHQLSVDYLAPESFARRPLLWLQLISRNRCTHSFSPGFGYELCARLAEREESRGLDLSCWRVAGVGGDMIKPEVLEKFAGAYAVHGFRNEALLPSYGLAEATLAVSFQPLGEGMKVDAVDKTRLKESGVAHPAKNPAGADTRRFAACGQLLPQFRAEIRDDSGKPLPERHVGQLYIAGPSLMDGYYKDTQSTEAILPDGQWLDTGDMGYLLEGRLHITGRRKDMLIIKGRNIWPQDLEWYVERTVHGLRSGDAAAFSHEDASGEEFAVVLVQCRNTAPDERDQLRREVASALRRQSGIDCRVELIPAKSLPFTSSGKLMRSEARKRWLSGSYSPQNKE